MAADTEIIPPVKPVLAKVTIFEVAERPWGWLTTSAEVDDRVYVGSESSMPPPPLLGGGLPVCTGPSSEIRIGKAEREKRKKDRRPNAFFRARQGCHSKKLCTICKFCMFFVALIPVINYNAQNTFKIG